VVLPAALLHAPARQVPEALKHAGMPLHILVAFGGIALFALATGVAVAYLLLERQMKGKHFGVLFSRLPSLETLDEISDGLMKWGFVALSITLITGAFFAKKAWGDYWRWAPQAHAVAGGLVPLRRPGPRAAVRGLARPGGRPC
jgi:ABC-type transport system involved in cytochrome c biogenesis permease subunit